MPTLTVCMVTHDRPSYVRTCLESLRAQSISIDAFEVLVVDSCGTPETNAALREMVASLPNARLLRVDKPGVSAARNLGASASKSDFLAFLDDDALAAPDWLEQIRTVIMEHDPWPGVIGGRVLPVWEEPLPSWWPDSLRGVLSIIEWEGRGEFRTTATPPDLEPYGVNMVVQRQPLLEIGGFDECVGRFGNKLLSDEDVQVSWKLQDRGYSAWYDSRIVVRHQIQGSRMNPEWLIDRLYWQGASTVSTRRMLGESGKVWRELPRRLLVEAVTGLAGLVPKNSTWLIPLRWRLAYARDSPAWRSPASRRSVGFRCLPCAPSACATARRSFPPSTLPRGPASAILLGKQALTTRAERGRCDTWSRRGADPCAASVLRTLGTAARLASSCR